jgi:hypothetical protein
MPSYLLNKLQAREQIANSLDNAGLEYAFRDNDGTARPDELQFCHSVLTVKCKDPAQQDPVVKLLQAVAGKSDDLNEAIIAVNADEMTITAYFGKLLPR